MATKLDTKLEIKLPHFLPEEYANVRHDLEMDLKYTLSEVTSALVASGTTPQHMKMITGELLHESFWHTLPLFVTPTPTSSYASDEPATSNRAQFLKTVSRETRQKYVDLLINQARVPAQRTAHPGSNYGHAIVLEILAKSPDVVLTEPQLRLLSTVALFETLPTYGFNGSNKESSVHQSIDMLMGMGRGIDIKALPAAQHAYKKNTDWGAGPKEYSDFSLIGMPSQYLVALSQLVGQSHLALGDTKLTERIAGPLIQAFFRQDDDGLIEVPHEELGSSVKPYNSPFTMALSQPWLNDMIVASPKFREIYTKGMSNLLFGFRFGEASGSFDQGVDILKSLPARDLIVEGLDAKVRNNVYGELAGMPHRVK